MRREYIPHPIWMFALMKNEKNSRFLHPLRCTAQNMRIASFSRYLVWICLISRRKYKGKEGGRWSRNMLRCWSDRGRDWHGGRALRSPDSPESGGAGGRSGRGGFCRCSLGGDIAWEERPAGGGQAPCRGATGSRPELQRRLDPPGSRADSLSAELSVRSWDFPVQNTVELLSERGPKYRRQQWVAVSDDFLCCPPIPAGPLLPTRQREIQGIRCSK